MEALSIVWRTLLVYFVINIILRIMGKREIGKLSVFDLVISIMIAEMAALLIGETDRPIWEGVLPMVVLALTQVTIAYFTLKNRTVRNVFEGRPSVIIENGKLNREEMRRQRYSLDDLMMQLRESKVNNVADVEFAILETTGKLSVTTRQEFRGADGRDPQDSGQSKKSSVVQFNGKEGKPVTFRYEGLPIPLIMDGKVHDENLKVIGKTRFWLKNELQNRGISDAKDVFLCTIDHRGKMFIDKK
ncbi:DUF421 domain-containing protein [Paenibacillus alkalitolerans]|uniref:YetF domain-containing protein n=1 Tax=Paenibacillus alkalitolerans TaxID=2799335 RepID=UPI0018F46ACA|nr:DUF421 domain-containing protein [Paenibacillus alkalitolerans]